MKTAEASEIAEGLRAHIAWAVFGSVFRAMLELERLRLAVPGTDALTERVYEPLAELWETIRDADV